MALMLAAAKGHTETVDLLLDRGASIEAKSAVDGRTALMLAAAKGHTETVGMLLDRGASIEATCNDGGTALIISAENGHIPVVFMLLDRGAAEDAKECRIACMYAAANQHIELFAKLYRFCGK
jgi:uncharacterized protein